MPGLDNRAAPAVPQTVAAWGLILAPDVHLRIGNRRPVIGKRKALAELVGLFDTLEEVGAEFRQVVGAGETIVAETSYRDVMRREGPTMPCAIILRMERGLISDVRFYIDQTPALREPKPLGS